MSSARSHGLCLGHNGPVGDQTRARPVTKPPDLVIPKPNAAEESRLALQQSARSIHVEFRVSANATFFSDAISWLRSLAQATRRCRCDVASRAFWCRRLLRPFGVGRTKR